MVIRTQTSRVIWHHSLSGVNTFVSDILRWHLERGFEDIGYHYIIMPDGHIAHGRDVKLRGAHASGKNADSVGVCLIGDFRYINPMVEQCAACVRIYHDLCRGYGKRLFSEYHREADEENPCPGILFDRVLFEKMLSECIV